MNSDILFMLAGILVAAGIVLWIMFRVHQAPQLDVDKYRKRWLEIERMLEKDNHEKCQFAIIQADKLLDHALKDNGVRGDTMGERMKTAKDRWSNRDAVWQAHKLRNKIVHEADVQVSYDSARKALAGFKRGLKDMGAI